MTGPNKRTFPRVQPKDEGYASFPEGAAGIRDLSLGGVMLKDREPLSVGSRILLNLHLGFETVSCSGVVRWAIPRKGMGVQFDELSAENRKRLGGYVMRVAMEENRQRLNETVGSTAPDQPTRIRNPPAAAKGSIRNPVVPPVVARRYELLPIGLAASILTIAVADPSNLAGLNEVKVRTGCGLRIVLAPARAIQEAIDRFYGERARDAG